MKELKPKYALFLLSFFYFYSRVLLTDGISAPSSTNPNVEANMDLLNNPLAPVVTFLLGVIFTGLIMFFFAEHIAAMKEIIKRRRLPYDTKDGILDVIALLRTTDRELEGESPDTASFLLQVAIDHLGQIESRKYDHKQPGKTINIRRAKAEATGD
ncbi:MAG: hypothetical protein FVQ79_04215 [Planctomycetes bacterium]|nr:hypothetical protein [Planctomycetota bacterium]